MKENLFYLPPYEDEATAEKIREIYGYPIRYMKQYLLDFFTALYEEQHHIYVLLENLPSTISLSKGLTTACCTGTTATAAMR